MKGFAWRSERAYSSDWWAAGGVGRFCSWQRELIQALLEITGARAALLAPHGRTWCGRERASEMCLIFSHLSPPRETQGFPIYNEYLESRRDHRREPQLEQQETPWEVNSGKDSRTSGQTYDFLINDFIWVSLKLRNAFYYYCISFRIRFYFIKIKIVKFLLVFNISVYSSFKF